MSTSVANTAPAPDLFGSGATPEPVVAAATSVDVTSATEELEDVVRDGVDPTSHGENSYPSGPDELGESALPAEYRVFVPGDGPTPEQLASIKAKAAKFGAAAPNVMQAAQFVVSQEHRLVLDGGGAVHLEVPLAATVRSPLALGREDRVPPVLIQQRQTEIVAMGQRKRCQARLLSDGGVEILSALVEWHAQGEIARTAGETGTVSVFLHQLDDQAALKLVYAESAEGLPVAPIDEARWASDAIVAFGSQRALAAALGLDESNVTRLLQVRQAVDALRHAIIDEWSMSRNQASRFMQLWNGREQRAEIRAFVKALPPASIAKTLGAVFARFAPKADIRPGDVDVIGEDGIRLGRIRRAGTGEVVIRLLTEAGAIELPTLVGFVEAALGRLRASAV